jgi:hypothetical protein
VRQGGELGPQLALGGEAGPLLQVGSVELLELGAEDVPGPSDADGGQRAGDDGTISADVGRAEFGAESGKRFKARNGVHDGFPQFGRLQAVDVHPKIATLGFNRLRNGLIFEGSRDTGTLWWWDRALPLRLLHLVALRWL